MGFGLLGLGMGNEVLKNGNGIEVMRVDSQFFYILKCFKIQFFSRAVSDHTKS
jgi:hypothetical protein